MAIADDPDLLPASLAWVLPLESLAEETPSPTTTLPLPDPDGEAYVIFTSGSSGQPKGVSVPLRAIGHLAREQSRLLDLTDQDSGLQFASLGFDASVSEMWMAWVSDAVLDLGEPGRGGVAMVGGVAGRRDGRLDDVVGRREVRLAGTEADDRPALGLEGFGLGVDG